MSCSIARRLTAALVLLAVLGLAAPAAAATPNRASFTKSPVTLGTGLLDQFLTWLGAFWPGADQGNSARQQKSVPVSTDTTDGTSEIGTGPLNQDRGGMIDPNGGS